MGQCLCKPRDGDTHGEDIIGVNVRKGRLKRHRAIKCASLTHSGKCPSSHQSYSSSFQSYQLAPPVADILRCAREALGTEEFPSVEAEVLCCLAFALSGGQEHLTVWAEDIDEQRLGLCQMTLATAQSLATTDHRMAYGWPTQQTLLSAVPALYFAAAALQQLSTFDDSDRSVAFTVKAYFVGAKTVCHVEQSLAYADGSTACRSAALGEEAQLPWERPWANFVKARRHLLNLSLLESLSEADIDPMHIVQKDESLASIARACQETVPELYRINPDLPASVQCGDCIALPRSCQPRLYRTQRGDTWTAVASWLQIPPYRLRSRNRDAIVVRHSTSFLMNLTNASVLLEGQLLEIPGLGNGTSVCSDDSRLDDIPPADMPAISPRQNPVAQWRAPSPASHAEVSLDARHTHSTEIVHANPHSTWR